MRTDHCSCFRIPTGRVLQRLISYRIDAGLLTGAQSRELGLECLMLLVWTSLSRVDANAYESSLPDHT